LRNIEEVKTCKSFDELLRLIERCTKHIPRFGALARYDFALRIGTKRGLWPECVYLHAGTRKGCKKLEVAARGKTVTVVDPLPETMLISLARKEEHPR
jgi:hypothetical protein